MFLFLSHYLSKYVSAFRVFEYVTFRGLIACIFSLFFSILIGESIIALFERLKLEQSIRDDGPKTHLKKSGTTTMGGVLIILSISLTTILFCDLLNPYIHLLLFTLISTGLIGFIDDYKKLKYKNSKGISARTKMLFLTIITSIILFTLIKIIKANNVTELIIPFSKALVSPLGLIGFAIISFFVIVGSSNAVNLTDGLDGLVTFPIITCAVGLAIFAYISGNKIFANYLLLPHIYGAHEIVVFCCALVGSCLGFLWFNAYPAQVFMGDVGSLSIGATLGTIAIILHQQIVYAIMAGLFVFEALSVIIQVFSYKVRKKRVLLMAPIHHHFELKGWGENKIVVRFWIISIILLLLALSTIKLR